MTDEDLKNIWAQQASSDRSILVSPDTVWRLARASERFERTIFWRDTREWLVTVWLASIFLLNAFRYRTIQWLPILAAVIVCLPMTYVAFLRWKRARPKTSSSLADHFRESITSLRHQIGLLRSVFWWYLLPLALSLLLIQIDATRTGRVHFDRWLLLSSAVAVGVFFGVWKLNQRVVRKDLEPRLRALEKTLAELAE
jgi:hypothetical protein